METKTKVWIAEDGKPVIGAGKVALLKAIDEERSLRKACKKLNISYKHAWNVLNKMNERMGKEVVRTVRGGKEQGTFLTELGRKLIEEYERNEQFVQDTMKDEASWENIGLKLSSRNRIPGMITKVETEGVAAKLTIDVNPSTITSIITSEAVQRLKLKEGDKVFAIIKSTEVLVGRRKVTEDTEKSKVPVRDMAKQEDLRENIGLKLSARNKIPGSISKVEPEGIVSKITIEGDPASLTSIITSEAVERLDLKEGDHVFAIIKSTEVLVGKASLQ